MGRWIRIWCNLLSSVSVRNLNITMPVSTDVLPTIMNVLQVEESDNPIGPLRSGSDSHNQSALNNVTAPGINPLVSTVQMDST